MQCLRRECHDASAPVALDIGDTLDNGVHDSDRRSARQADRIPECEQSPSRKTLLTSAQ